MKKLPDEIKVALGIFTLVGGVAVFLLPYVSRMFGAGDQPSVIQLALTGLALIALTAPLLNYAAKSLGFSRAWFALAFIYNSLIIIIKFVMSPWSLYGTTIQLGLGGFNPNNLSGLILPVLGVLAIYMAIFSIIYVIYRRKTKATVVPASSGDTVSVESHPYKLGMKILLVGILLVGGYATGTLFIPLFLGLPALTYLSYVFTGGVLIVLLCAVGVTIFTAIKTFDIASETAINMKNATMLASFFWLGLSMILIYHVLWVIYMAVMASIWPFKTIAPGK